MFLQGFCSELILWRVDAVGPLSKSGGVSELARINSLQISAFSNVAWIPTLLPRYYNSKILILYLSILCLIIYWIIY